MSVNTDHLIDDEEEPDLLPRPRPLIGSGIRFLAGNGLTVAQTKSSVIYSVADEIIQTVQRVSRNGANAAVNFGFAVSCNPDDGTVTIKEGLIRDLSWTQALGWHHREHDVPESILSNVEFPCLIYGRVPLEDVQSTGLGEGEFFGTFNINSTEYGASVIVATKTKRLTGTAIPVSDSSIYGWDVDSPVPSGSLFQFRVASIDEEGLVTYQYAVGTVTVPLEFTPIINEFTIV